VFACHAVAVSADWYHYVGERLSVVHHQRNGTLHTTAYATAPTTRCLEKSYFVISCILAKSSSIFTIISLL